VISRASSPAALPRRASVGGRGGRKRQSSSRPPAARNAADQAGHHGLTRREIGSTTSTGEPARARGVLELVHGERGDHTARWPRQDGGRGIASDDLAAQPELAQRPLRLGHGPAARVDAVDPRRHRTLERPRRAGGTGAAAEVEHLARRALAERAHDLAHEEEVKGTVVERERRTLAGAVERRAAAHALAPLDVERREGDERAADLGKRERGAVARLEGFEVAVKGVGGFVFQGPLARARPRV
jgi:hypothetical protein